MAHELATVNGKSAIAFVGETPWHGLGQRLTAGASIETWIEESGLNYPIKAAPVKFEATVGKKKIVTNEFNKRVVLYRGDTGDSLSVVSDSYKIVQPAQVLEFFRDIVAQGNMQIETAGALFGGTRYWAMANANMEGDVTKNDRIKGRLLLTSSCDGTLATTAKFISERVVCNNTLRIALAENEGKAQIRVSHGSVFDPSKIHAAMGLLDNGWDSFMKNIKVMAKTKVTDLDVKKFIADLMLNPKQLEAMEKEEAMHARVQSKLDTIFNLYKGEGMGADKVTGTLWGALNAVTEFADHRIGQIDDNRLWSSWFGFSENLKNKAFDQAKIMAGLEAE